MSTVKSMDMFGEVTKSLENEGRKSPAFGIDLGTTNSCIAVVQAGNTPKIIELEQGRRTMPSCVMWKGKPGEFVVGHQAYLNRYKQSAIYSVKRLMGTGETVKLRYGTKTLEMTPAEVSAEILKELVRQASVQYKDIKDVVITVPAYFNDRQVSDTLEAGKLAGLNVLNILREPTAATLVYESESLDESEVRLLAYDLGGGTFDTSLVRITKPTDLGDLEDIYGSIEGENTYSMLYTVLDTDGDSKLGGDDIDIEMYKRLESKILSITGSSPEDIRREDREKLILRMERIKKSGVGTYDIKVDIKLKDGKYVKEAIQMTQKDFLESTRVVYLKTKAKVQAVLERAGSYEIDGIVLIGGSTKSEIIKSFLKKDFPGVRINDALNPDEAVALGASVKAKESKFGDKNIEVFDVLPLSIGVLSDGHVKPIIRKNQRVPYTSGHPFTTVVDNQEKIEVHVYQGNSPLPEECLYLGTIELTNIPKGKAGEVRIYISMSVDSNGLLKCSVDTETSKKELTLVNLFGREQKQKTLSADERKARNWRSFANKLSDEKAKSEVLEAVDQFLSGDKTASDVAVVIRKYAEYKTKVTKPSDNDTSIKYDE